MSNPVIAVLEGREIREGDTLYGLDGAKFSARRNESPRTRVEAPLRLEYNRRGNSASEWLTHTHWQGVQVLFWEPRTQQQLDEFRQSELQEKERNRERLRQEYVANMTDPDAYMCE